MRFLKLEAGRGDGGWGSSGRTEPYPSTGITLPQCAEIVGDNATFFKTFFFFHSRRCCFCRLSRGSSSSFSSSASSGVGAQCDDERYAACCFDSVPTTWKRWRQGAQPGVFLQLQSRRRAASRKDLLYRNQAFVRPFFTEFRSFQLLRSQRANSGHVSLPLLSLCLLR